MDYTLSHLAGLTAATGLHGSLHGTDRRFSRIVTDSRNSIAEPETALFVALAGPHHCPTPRSFRSPTRWQPCRHWPPTTAADSKAP